MPDKSRYAEIGVAPYPDGSGYQAIVKAYRDELDDPVFEINITYRLEAAQWPALKRAVEDALALAEHHPPRAATLA